MKLPKVSNLVNDNNRATANQFVIGDGQQTVFQSYETVVACIKNGKVYVTKEALEPCCTESPSSVTTRKHLYIFLRDYAYLSIHSIRDLKAYVKQGRIIANRTL